MTLDEYAARPDPEDGTFDELIDGVVVYRPLASALHGYVCASAAGLLGAYRRQTGIGTVSLRCGMVVSRHPDTVIGPDVSYWRDRPAAALGHDWPTVPPDAAFKVVDTNEPYSEVLNRVRRLLRFGIKLFWVGEPVGRFVTEFRDGRQRQLEASATLDGGDVLPGFACMVADLFG